MFDRLRAKSASRREQSRVIAGAEAALVGFADSHTGVAAWVEQAAGFNKPSLLLVADTGEWLRRSVPDIDWGRDFAARSHLACFTAGIDPYPRRMREWDAAHRRPTTPQE